MDEIDATEDIKKQVFMALVFAEKILFDVQQWTSRHCTDCMMNRTRAEFAVDFIRELIGSSSFEKTFKDRYPEAHKKLDGLCRTISKDMIRQVDKMGWESIGRRLNLHRDKNS